MKIKNKNGVTLAILVLTAVVLVIIVGIAFIEVVDNGIITKTENTVDKYNNRIDKTYEYENNAIHQNIVDFKVQN